MLVVSTAVLLCVMLYAVGQGIRDGTTEQPVSIFLPTYLLLCTGVCNAFLAGDLFNLFVSFEVLLAASFVLLTLGASADRVRAGVSYVMVSMVSSLVFLAGIAFAYAATGHPEPRRDGGAAAKTYPMGHGCAVRGAAGGVRHQGCGVPAVDVAARLLSDRARAGHRRLRGVADQGRRLRDHPRAHPAVPRWLDGQGAAGCRTADDAGRHLRCHRPVRHQTIAVVHAGQPHRLHDLRHRPVHGVRAVAARSTTWPTTFSCRRPCSWWWV